MNTKQTNPNLLLCAVLSSVTTSCKHCDIRRHRLKSTSSTQQLWSSFFDLKLCMCGPKAKTNGKDNIYMYMCFQSQF